MHGELRRYDNAFMHAEVERLLIEADPPRDSGNPFEKGIGEVTLARRFNGRKFVEVRHGNAGRSYEILYRCVLFDRFVPRVGLDGSGLYQFWGQRAVRDILPSGEKSDWKVEQYTHQSVPASALRLHKRR